MISQYYIGLSAFTVLTDMVLVLIVFLKRDSKSKYLSAMLYFAGLVVLFYSLSIFAPTYFNMSLFSSLHFASIDIMAFWLLMYCCVFMDTINKKWNIAFLAVAAVLIVLDICVLMVNPFIELSLTYVYSETAIAHWRYSPYFLYDCHLILCYCMVAMTLVNYIYKIATTPRIYRGRYSAIIIALMLVVAMNALFLFLPNNDLPDFSVLFYSVAGLIFYLSAYQNANRGMLNQAREMVLKELGHPMVLFDYENKFTTSNSAAAFLLPVSNLNHEYTLKKFLTRNDFNPGFADSQNDTSFQWRTNQNGITRSYRCDFRVLKDKKGKVLGRLFVFTDNSLEIDLLTGFDTQTYFMNNIVNRTRPINYPVSFAVVDLNRLSELNVKGGREKGDAAISALANSLRAHFPEDSAFVRLDDAELMVICENSSAKQMYEHLDEVQEELSQVDFGYGSLSIQSAVAMATSADPDIMKAIHEASSSMRARKLLDASSAHSSLLNSFVQTQRESDGETESHVQRTRDMGEHLGRRLGFTDRQLSSLALLCLLHDIGKVGVPLEILNKPGKLTDTEWEIMKSHSEKGYRIAKASPELSGIADLILHHHEAWNGTGYPDGLKGELIPVLSRTIAIVDTYDAMTHDRPYRPAMPAEAAKAEIRRCAGTQFDPFMVSEFLQMLEENPEIDAATRGEDLFDEKKSKSRKVLNPRGGENQPERRMEAESYNTPLPYSKYILDEKNNVLEIDEQFTRITGYTDQDVKDYKLTQIDLILPEDRDDYIARVSALLEDVGEACIEHRLRRKDGSFVYVLCYGRQYYNPVLLRMENSILITNLSDTKAMQYAIERERTAVERTSLLLEDEMRKDKLVGILNREAFRADVQARLLEDKELAVMIMLDLDFFKQYNDSYGHPQGDKLLVVVGAALEKAVSLYGIACRIGGDEYAAALFFDKSEKREVIREEVKIIYRQVIEEINSYDQNITLSMGAFTSDEAHPTFTSLYQAADQLLYDAKNSGRNCLKIGF